MAALILLVIGVYAFGFGVLGWVVAIVIGIFLLSTLIEAF